MKPVTSSPIISSNPAKSNHATFTRLFPWSFLLCAIPFFANAQPKSFENFLPGFYITLQGDTVQGAIATIDVTKGL
jgi:hypothetical protein